MRRYWQQLCLRRTNRNILRVHLSYQLTIDTVGNCPSKVHHIVRLTLLERGLHHVHRIVQRQKQNSSSLLRLGPVVLVYVGIERCEHLHVLLRSDAGDASHNLRCGPLDVRFHKVFDVFGIGEDARLARRLHRLLELFQDVLGGRALNVVSHVFDDFSKLIRYAVWPGLLDDEQRIPKVQGFARGLTPKEIKAVALHFFCNLLAHRLSALLSLVLSKLAGVDNRRLGSGVDGVDGQRLRRVVGRGSRKR